MDKKDNFHNHRLNKKYSTSLLAITVLFSIAGLSLRVAYDAIFMQDNSDKQDRVVEINSMPENIPSIILTPPPDLSAITGSGSDASEMDSGSGADIEEVATGSGANIPESVTFNGNCGAVDSDRNGMIQKNDFNDFQKTYLKACSDSDIVYMDNCGNKDFDNNKKININDFVNFMNKYKIGICK